MERNKKKIKIHNISNLHDARFLASLGIEYISLNLANPKAWNIPVEQLNDILQWIEGNRIGIYLETAIEHFLTKINLNALKFIEIPYEVSATAPTKTTNKLIIRCSLEEVENARNNFPDALLDVKIETPSELQKLLQFNDKNFFVNLDKYKGNIPSNVNISIGEKLTSSENGLLDYDKVEDFISELL